MRLKGELYKDFALEFERKGSVVWTQIFKKGNHNKILSSYISNTKKQGLNKGKDWIDKEISLL